MGRPQKIDSRCNDFGIKIGMGQITRNADNKIAINVTLLSHMVGNKLLMPLQFIDATASEIIVSNVRILSL